jgi:pilus assembly protein Flp/PilA
MRGCAESVVNFLKREDGPTAVEYAVMLVLSIVVCITAITAIGEQSGLGMRIREVDRMPAWSDGGGI